MNLTVSKFITAANAMVRCRLALCLIFVPMLVFAYSGGPPNGKTGAPGEGTCHDCHFTYDLDSGPGVLTINGPTTFEPEQTYQITVTLDQVDRSRWGFEFSPLDVGTCTITDETNTQLDVEDGKTYVKHTSQGTYNGDPGPVSWSFDWTAPVDPPLEITFYAAGNAANGNGSPDGDYIYTASLTSGLVPIELVSFGAEVLTSGILLSWRTLSEVDNAGFLVYRSEGAGFRPLSGHLIPGAGTTVIPQDYSYLDRDVAPGYTYRYQLADVTLSGEKTFHGTIDVAIPRPERQRLQLRISPRPAKERTQIAFSSSEAGFMHMFVVDVQGRIIRELGASTVQKGEHTVHWDLLDAASRRVSPGVYVCRLFVGTETASAPLVITK